MGVDKISGKSKKKGRIFDVQRYSVHDGPGIRTLIFFKGCRLRCQWCSNPESWLPNPQLLYDDSTCVQCGACIEACSRQAVRRAGQKIIIDRKICQGCGDCLDVCYYDARRIAGKQMSVDELIQEIEKDTIFYRNSNGGVTLSGGEVLTQADFAASLLKECKKVGFHTAIETCGLGPFSEIEKLLPYLDLVLYDLKHLDDEKHREQTGASNKEVLSNFKVLVRKNVPIIPRIPLIPGLNDSREELENICSLLKESGLNKFDVLSYHRMGMSKYGELGYDYTLKKLTPFSTEELDKIMDLFKARGFEVSLHRV